MNTLFGITLPNHANGEQRRDAALSQLAESRPAIIRRLKRAAIRIALDSGTVTADDVRAVVPIPITVNPKVNGSALFTLAGLGILTGGEYVRSIRPVAHARPVRVWYLGGRDAALLWLAMNPDPIDSNTTL